MKNVMLENEATHLRATAEALGKLLEEKCLAYGGAHNRQVDIWAAVLRQYEEERDGQAGYWIPDALVYHMPRLTRVFDRVMRIVANPANDHGGEDPWRDMAGDCLAGTVMPKPAATGRCAEYPDCERRNGHAGPHGKVDAAGLHEWMSSPQAVAPDGEEPEPCGEWFPCAIGNRRCAKPNGHEGRHRCAGGFSDERSQEYLDKLKAKA